jgi:hypothetical protein
MVVMVDEEDILSFAVTATSGPSFTSNIRSISLLLTVAKVGLHAHSEKMVRTRS